MVARIAQLSFRLGGTDGVAIEATKWRRALQALGHTVTTVAGSGPVDVTIEGLERGAGRPDEIRLQAIIASHDLVIVENLCSLPLNPEASDAVWRQLHQRTALFHHHDLAWQRPHLAHLEGPRDEPDWTHVVINRLSQHQLAQRGISSHLLYNSFDLDPDMGDRARARDYWGLTAERLFLLPTRAIGRKNIPLALDLAKRHGAHLWIVGAVEDDYDTEYNELVASTSVPVLRLLPHELSLADAYAAADMVLMTSTWEGFGNPTIEAVAHRRPLILNPYPVAAEIRAHGFAFFDPQDQEGIEQFLVAPDPGVIAHNLDVARRFFNVDDLPQHLHQLLQRCGVEHEG